MVLHSYITSKILRAFYEVYHELGYGFLENVYQNALYKELLRSGLKCEPQKKIEVYYKGEVVGLYYADILVEGVVILELKAVEAITPATGIEVGLVLNFGPEPAFRRKICSRQYKK